MTTPEWNDGGYGGYGDPDRPAERADPTAVAYGGQEWSGYASHPAERATTAPFQPAYAQPLAAEQHVPQGFPAQQAAYQDPQPYAPAYGYAAAQAPAVEEPAPAAPRRTGSPIIAPGLQPAVLTAVFGVLTAVAAALGRSAMVAPAVLLQAVTAAGWFRLNGMWPARQGIALAFLAGLAVDVGLFVTGGRHAPAVAAGALGVWLSLILVQQLRHHGSAEERLAGLTATAASTVLTVLASGYLAVAGTAAGHRPVVVGAAAVAVATLLRALPLPSVVSVAVSVLGAAGSGVACGQLTGLGTTPAVLIALAAGVCALVGLRVASYDFPSRFVHFTAGVALPLTVAAPVVYMLAQVLI